MKKRKPLEVFKIKIPIYDVVLYVLVGDRETANHWCSKKYGVKEKMLEGQWVYQFTSVEPSTGPSEYIIYLDEFECTGGEIAGLTHEITHAAFEILGDLGFKPSGDSEEAYGYLAGYLMSESLRRLAGAELRRRKDKKKKGKKRKWKTLNMYIR